MDKQLQLWYRHTYTSVCVCVCVCVYYFRAKPHGEHQKFSYTIQLHQYSNTETKLVAQDIKHALLLSLLLLSLLLLYRVIPLLTDDIDQKVWLNNNLLDTFFFCLTLLSSCGAQTASKNKVCRIRVSESVNLHYLLLSLCSGKLLYLHVAMHYHHHYPIA